MMATAFLTLEITVNRLKFTLTVGATETGFYPLKMECRPLSKCSFAYEVPIELNRVSHYAGKVADHQIEVDDPFSVTRVAKSDAKNILGNW